MSCWDCKYQKHEEVLLFGRCEKYLDFRLPSPEVPSEIVDIGCNYHQTRTDVSVEDRRCDSQDNSPEKEGFDSDGISFEWEDEHLHGWPSRPRLEERNDI